MRVGVFDHLSQRLGGSQLVVAWIASVLLPAIAAGTPVTCTAPVKEADGSTTEANCLIVDPDPASVVSAIRRVFSDAALREQLRAAGLETAAKHSWDHVAGKVADFYVSVGTRYCPISKPQGEGVGASGRG